MKLLPISSERTLEKCNEYQDFGTLTVFIASYPKSGTTWLQSICYHLLLKNIEKSGNSSLPHLNHISDYAPFYEIDKTWDPCANDARLLAKYDEAHAKLNCRLFNTHLLPHIFHFRIEEKPKPAPAHSLTQPLSHSPTHSPTHPPTASYLPF